MRKLLQSSLFWVLSVIALCSATCFVGCEQKKEQKPIKEGIIKFHVTYPHYKDSFMASFMPNLMTMHFKDNKYRNVVSKGGLFSTTLIADCEKRELIMMLDLSPKKYYCVLDTALTDTMLAEYSRVEIMKTLVKDSLAGILCNRYWAVFDNLADGYDIELYETDLIDIKNSNWCTQFSRLPGVLLGYEIERYGLQMRMRAQEIQEVKVSDSVFMVPPDYKEVNLKKMLYEMEEIFKSLVY